MPHAPVFRFASVAPLALVAALTASAGVAHAADPLVVASGKVVLPLTGLAIELPKDKRKGATWSLTGSWSLSNDGKTFDGRDVIDQKVDGKLVGGNWVHIGYFDAGDCAKVVSGLEVPDRWLGTSDAFGQKWQVAAGTWDFESELGKAPVIAMCAPKTDRASLLLYHFFVGDPLDANHEARLAKLAKDPLIKSITTAWDKDKTGAVQPTRRPELNRRGDLQASRDVHLSKSNLDLTLPSDGFVWLVRGDDADANSDFLDRMAPTLPDVTLEIARAPGAKCEDLFDWEDAAAPKRKAEPPPKNLPSGWKALPTLDLGTTAERIACHEGPTAAIVVGLIATPTDIPEAKDFGPFSALMAGIATRSDAAQ